MNFFTKKLTIPVANETMQVDVVQLWEVRWLSRHGMFSGDTRKEAEWFSSEAEAQAFAESLRAAFKLVRCTHGAEVTLQKAKSV